MKIADCGHYPKNPAKPQADHCEGGEETNHQVIASYPADENSFIWCYEHSDYLKK